MGIYCLGGKGFACLVLCPGGMVVVEIDDCSIKFNPNLQPKFPRLR